MFADRTESGRQLARQLASIDLHRPVVLAIPRGGAPVGVEIARALNAEFDVALVRKLRHPAQPELAIGAVGEQGELTLNPGATRSVSREELSEEIERRIGELRERSRIYREARPAADVTGRDVILVDDGVATGATMEAAIDAARQRGAARIIVALPVAPPETADRLAERADALVCLEKPEHFQAVAQFYRSFEQTSDEEVVQSLCSVLDAGG